MNCGQCVFFSRSQHIPVSPPCPSCLSDTADKGFCVAVHSENEYVPVVTRIFDETRAYEIIRRGAEGGTQFMLLSWSVEDGAYQCV